MGERARMSQRVRARVRAREREGGGERKREQKRGREGGWGGREGGDGERDLVRGLPKLLQSGLNDGRGVLMRPIVSGLKCLLEVALFHGESLAAPGCVKVAQHPEIELVQNLCMRRGGEG